MNPIFRCPSCGAALDGEGEPLVGDPNPCPHCGWRNAPRKHPSRIAGSLFQTLVIGLLGMLMGALVAHALYLALPLFIVLGPMAAMQIARRTEDPWWIHVLIYSAALAAGMILFSDGRTLTPREVSTPVSGAVLTAVAGVLAGLLRRPE